MAFFLILENTMIDKFDDNLFEEAYLKKATNYTTVENGTMINTQSNAQSGLIITKAENVDQYLRDARKERDAFRMSRKSDDHYTKVASIPRILYDKIMSECDELQMTNKKDRQKYLINKIKSPEFQAFLSIPPNFIRN